VDLLRLLGGTGLKGFSADRGQSELEEHKRRRQGSLSSIELRMGWESRSNCRISGDRQLCRDITAHLEHAFSGRQSEWRVSIAGSRAAENWALRVEGPNGLGRSYTLSGTAGEHELLAIPTLVPRLVPPAKP